MSGVAESAQPRVPTLAIVEDDPHLREGLGELCRSWGYHVLQFEDGLAALEAFRSPAGRPDVILLDLFMPRMDGWAFRKTQRSLPELSEIPVVLMSADASRHAPALGVADFLNKPVGGASLQVALHRTLSAAERRRVEEAAAQVERLRLMGMMVATVAHELNTPLAIVHGNLELASRALSTLDPPHGQASALEKLRGFIDDAVTGSERAVAIARDLRSFTRVEDDEHEFADPAVAIALALGMSKPMASGVARIHADIEPSLPPVRGNAARLSQVFLNLLINACQAIPRGAPEENTIRVRAFRRARKVIVEVTDTGLGLPALVAPRLFEPFFTTKPAHLGTGLGLSVSRGILERYGGTIQAASSQGAGATFTVELPTVAAPEPTTQGPPA